MLKGTNDEYVVIKNQVNLLYKYNISYKIIKT